jgi:AcrR family transcriptional regulator
MSSDCEPITGRPADIAMAARALIAERGFEGLRTRDIAARVGINVATLHYHVPSKEALIQLVARSLRDDFVAQNVARPRAGLPALEQLKLEFRDFRETLVDTPEIFVVMTELTERARRDDNVRAVVGPMLAFAHGELARILSLGRDEGAFRADLDPEAGALMIFGTMVATQRSPKRSSELFDLACDELLRSVTARPQEPRSA